MKIHQLPWILLSVRKNVTKDILVRQIVSSFRFEMRAKHIYHVFNRRKMTRFLSLFLILFLFNLLSIVIIEEI